jgi:hypothetical protein
MLSRVREDYSISLNTSILPLSSFQTHFLVIRTTALDQGRMLEQRVMILQDTSHIPKRLSYRESSCARILTVKFLTGSHEAYSACYVASLRHCHDLLRYCMSYRYSLSCNFEATKYSAYNYRRCPACSESRKVI